jgi:hypothetical protein
MLRDLLARPTWSLVTFFISALSLTLRLHY